MVALRKVGTAFRVFRATGVGGLAAVVRRYAEDWVTSSARLQSLIAAGVALRGNVVALDGLLFSVDDPGIPAAVKASLAAGLYERAERAAMHHLLDRELPLVELGGSLGVVACLSNRRLRDRGRHVVVEANPLLVPLLTRNRDANACEFTIVNKALAYGGDQVSFFLHPEPWASRLTGDGESRRADAARIIQVPATTFRALIDGFGFERCTLICDIEGAERDLIEHEGDVLRDRVSTLVLETHEYVLGADRVEQMLAELERLGFDRVHEAGSTIAFKRASHH